MGRMRHEFPFRNLTAMAAVLALALSLRASPQTDAAAAVDAAIKPLAGQAAAAEAAASGDGLRVLNFARLKREQLAGMRERVAAARAAQQALRAALRDTGAVYAKELAARGVPETLAAKDAKLYAADRATLNDLLARLGEQEDAMFDAVLGLLDLAQKDFGQWFATAAPRLKPGAPLPALPYGFKFKSPSATARYNELIDQALKASAEHAALVTELDTGVQEGSLKAAGLSTDELTAAIALSLDGETPLVKPAQ
jgi:hypothetical protein